MTFMFSKNDFCSILRFGNLAIFDFILWGLEDSVSHQEQTKQGSNNFFHFQYSKSLSIGCSFSCRMCPGNYNNSKLIIHYKESDMSVSAHFLTLVRRRAKQSP